MGKNGKYSGTVASTSGIEISESDFFFPFVRSFVLLRHRLVNGGEWMGRGKRSGEESNASRMWEYKMKRIKKDV